MGAALFGVDVVGVAEDGLAVAVVILDGDLDGAVVLFLFKIDGLFEQRLFVAVEVFHEVQDAALVAEFVELGGRFALVADGDGQPLVEVGELAQAHLQIIVIEDDRLENVAVGIEGDLGARLVGIADDGEGALRHAAVVDLLVDVAVLVYFHFQPFGQGVDDREADAVQAAGNFIAAAAELAARVQLGEHQLDGGDALFGVDARGDAAAVVFDGTGAVRIDGDADGIAIARQRLVDGVVDDLLHEVMQAPLVRRTDIHTGALADGFQPFEHLYLLLPVFALHFFCHTKNLRNQIILSPLL